MPELIAMAVIEVPLPPDSQAAAALEAHWRAFLSAVPGPDRAALEDMFGDVDGGC